MKEETGYDVIRTSINEIGIVTERRKDKYEDGIWDMRTYLYSCEVNPLEREELKLTENEIKHGMKCVFLTPAEAILNNEEALKNNQYTEWLYRDLELLKLLFKNKNKV